MKENAISTADSIRERPARSAEVLRGPSVATLFLWCPQSLSRCVGPAGEGSTQLAFLFSKAAILPAPVTVVCAPNDLYISFVEQKVNPYHGGEKN